MRAGSELLPIFWSITKPSAEESAVHRLKSQPKLEFFASTSEIN